MAKANYRYIQVQVRIDQFVKGQQITDDFTIGRFVSLEIVWQQFQQPLDFGFGGLANRSRGIVSIAHAHRKYFHRFVEQTAHAFGIRVVVLHDSICVDELEHCFPVGEKIFFRITFLAGFDQLFAFITICLQDKQKCYYFVVVEKSQIHKSPLAMCDSAKSIENPHRVLIVKFRDLAIEHIRVVGIVIHHTY